MQNASGNIKKISLELGGKSANIVFSDCDFEAALGGSLSAIFMNAGQMCVAGSRILVEDKIYDKFIKQLVERTQNLKIGDNLDHSTDIGPMISKEQRDSVLKYIEIGKKEGAKLLCGGKAASGKGYFIEPTIFEAKNNMRIAQEEIFGPVLCVMKFSGIDEAIKIANDTKYGLAGMIWSKDLDKAERVAKKLRCGQIWINTYGFFHNEAPFGGYKQSGIGRELGKEGFLEYTELKHVNTDLTPGGKSLSSQWF
jgi:acyl-CoA reductase-like NAD-dependent aldehyde dehydrogenase